MFSAAAAGPHAEVPGDWPLGAVGFNALLALLLAAGLAAAAGAAAGAAFDPAAKGLSGRLKTSRALCADLPADLLVLRAAGDSSLPDGQPSGLGLPCTCMVKSA